MADTPNPGRYGRQSRQARHGRLSVVRSAVDGVRILALHGEIDHAVKDEFSEALIPEDGVAPPRTVVDLSDVTFMDSSGINVFIAAHHAVKETQGWLRIAAPRESVLRVIQLIGLDAVIPCHTTLEQARTS
ncbi:anti-sigma factor antagonist [Streptomyces venezuelae]|uniref:Anti-sigma factor antagonist n=1 Tax=Streptomyces venezuelae TaxID=54571 RepID=A0A5P2C5U2_STRVZ|nr:STAS domain-containing protein [Streptomyces venezuelae]QES38054.1 anti-sigma factor antagonist [Streptomyces venezuelae]